jgi:hypothetical protein
MATRMKRLPSGGKSWRRLDISMRNPRPTVLTTGATLPEILTLVTPPSLKMKMIHKR